MITKKNGETDKQYSKRLQAYCEVLEENNRALRILNADQNKANPRTGRTYQEEAEELLKKDIEIAEEAINKYVVVPLTQNRFDALVSFVFNVGVGAFKQSTLLKKLNQGLYDEIDEELAKWVYVS